MGGSRGSPAVKVNYPVLDRNTALYGNQPVKLLLWDVTDKRFHSNQTTKLTSDIGITHAVIDNTRDL